MIQRVKWAKCRAIYVIVMTLLPIYLLNFNLHAKNDAGRVDSTGRKMNLESKYRDQSPSKKLVGMEDEVTGKVAFIFLIQKEFPTASIWTRYLLGAKKADWTAYVHIEPGQDAEVLPLFFRQFVLSADKRKKTVYCNDLVTATVALVSAAIDDASNKKFVLLSPTHIPVQPFPLLRQILLRDNATWLCITPSNQWLSKTPGAEQIKHHQWFALARDEAERRVLFPGRHLGACWDEHFIQPPPTEGLTEDHLRRTGGRPWPGINDGFLHTRTPDTPASANSLEGAESSNYTRALLVEQGRCTSYVFWDDYPPASFFRAADRFWHDTQLHGGHDLDPISFCLLRGLKDETGFLFARKIIAGARVSYKCLGAGDIVLPLEDALADPELGVLPP